MNPDSIPAALQFRCAVGIIAQCYPPTTKREEKSLGVGGIVSLISRLSRGGISPEIHQFVTLRKRRKGGMGSIEIVFPHLLPPPTGVVGPLTSYRGDLFDCVRYGGFKRDFQVVKCETFDKGWSFATDLM